MENPASFTSRKPWLWPILVLLVGVLAFAGLAASKSAPAERPDENTATLVDTLEVDLQTLTLSVESRGLVAPKYQTDLIAQVSGEVLSVSAAFSRGGLVERGELLATIDPTNYEVRVEEALAAVASAEAALELEQAQGQVARSEWEKVKGIAVPDLGVRKPQLAQAQAQLTAARAALKQAEKDLERTRVVAPYDALIAGRGISPGTYVSPGTHIGELMDVRTAEVRLPVARADLAYLDKGGQGAEVRLSGEANGRDAEWPALIQRSEGVIDETTRMTYLVAEVQDPYRLQGGNAGPILPFGSYVTAQINGIEITAAVALPRHLLRDDTLALAEDGRLRFAPVEVLRHYGGTSVIAGGLQEGDAVITSALEFAVDGMAVEVNKRTQPGVAVPADDSVYAEEAL